MQRIENGRGCDRFEFLTAIRRGSRMNHGKTVLAQVLDGLHPEHFRRCAQRMPMRRDTPALSAYDQFAAMVFAQLTYRESLRDIEGLPGLPPPRTLSRGIRGAVKRCNLAYANEHRDWRLFADVARVLMRQAPPVSCISLSGKIGLWTRPVKRHRPLAS